MLQVFNWLAHVAFVAGALADWMEDVNARVKHGVDYAKSRGMIKTGDAVIIVTGWQKGSGFTNTQRIVIVD